ncbi:ATPase [Sulfitobacter phage phiCB2047-B]|uniref:ATPase n=1 Tax=Sulfitobacter phage phiCB2047-B TaxID=754046 RepID=M4PMU2_9CAUD|nr:ATPase [Sulfitobacter phage phiCB2047-B]AGH07422.1 ATPase [Sulfitobacter phage phiCB2047-B]
MSSSSDILKLTPSEAFEFITTALSCRQVPYVSGPPGIGKSDVVRQVAFIAKAKVIDLRLSQVLSEDLTGLPERDADTGKATYLPFDTFPLEGDKIPDGFNGWLLFLDELSSASEEVLAAAYSLILDRTVGGRKLHPKCLVVAAGNRASDSAIARELPDTLITRMLPFEMKTSSKDWLNWAKTSPNSNESVIDFLKKKTNLLYSPTAPKDRDELETYPQPRGWEKFMTIMNFHELPEDEEDDGESMLEDQAGIPIEASDGPKLKKIGDITFSLLSACVGSLAARTFREEYDESILIPYPWEVAMSPSSIRIPPTHVGKAKLIQSIAEHYLKNDNATRENLLTYVNRIGGEYSELLLSIIKGSLKDTQSDKKMIQDISDRLSIDPLLGTAPKGGEGLPDSSSPTF